MSQTVWKVQVPVDGRYHLEGLPGNARITRVEATSPDVVSAWFYIADDGELNIDWWFTVSGTGHPMGTTAQFLGTAPVPGLPLVWHLWRTRPPEEG